MNMDILKKALLKGIGSGVLGWLLYGVVFKLLADHKPIQEALFDSDSLIFLAAITVADVIAYYLTDAKKAKKQQ